MHYICGVHINAYLCNLGHNYYWELHRNIREAEDSLLNLIFLLNWEMKESSWNSHLVKSETPDAAGFYLFMLSSPVLIHLACTWTLADFLPFTPYLLTHKQLFFSVLVGMHWNVKITIASTSRISL